MKDIFIQSAWWPVSFLLPWLIKYTGKNEAEAGLRKPKILQFQDFKYFKIKICIDKIHIP